MPKGLNGVAPSMGGAGAPFVALEVSALSRAVGIGGPELNRAGTHRLAPAGTAGLPERIGQARSGAGGPSRALPACEAGCEGFRLARRARAGDRCRGPRSSGPRGCAQEEESEDGPDRHPQDGAAAAVPGRRRPGRDAAGADPDGRGGGREAAAAEAGAPCEERLRPADAVAGPLGLHGVSAGDPAEPGFRARPDGLGTGYGTKPPPGQWHSVKQNFPSRVPTFTFLADYIM